ncbi:MAG: hypothetical protein ACRDWI_12890 [Jiangellaceae bacterium]
MVLSDAPDHRERRRVLNPHVHTKALGPQRERLTEIVAEMMPVGRFDAIAWSAATVRTMLNEVFFGGRLSETLLASFLRPLHGAVPRPFLPRPVLFRRMDRAIDRAVSDPQPETLAAGSRPECRRRDPRRARRRLRHDGARAGVGIVAPGRVAAVARPGRPATGDRRDPAALPLRLAGQ